MIGDYICDFVCSEAALIIELDGSQHVAAADYDARRDKFLRSHGFRVLRFWNATILNETDAVLETIFRALHSKELDGRFD
jgi:very-short-patch-repair endonuclease